MSATLQHPLFWQIDGIVASSSSFASACENVILQPTVRKIVCMQCAGRGYRSGSGMLSEVACEVDRVEQGACLWRRVYRLVLVASAV